MNFHGSLFIGFLLFLLFISTPPRATSRSFVATSRAVERGDESALPVSGKGGSGRGQREALLPVAKGITARRGRRALRHVEDAVPYNRRGGVTARTGREEEKQQYINLKVFGRGTGNPFLSKKVPRSKDYYNKSKNFWEEFGDSLFFIKKGSPRKAFP